MKTLIPIGGALDKEDPRVMREFIARAGGKQANILIFPQASALPETGTLYVQQCLELGASQAQALEFRERRLADNPDHLRAVQQASGIFFTGGAQMRLTQLLGGTLLETALQQAYQRGCIIAGTSAGASVLSKTMIAYGKNGPTPRAGILQFSPGLGFTDKFTFDQHFQQRNRFGRLIYAVATHPGILGIGIDEDTAAIIEDDETLTVCGSGAVTIVDGREIGETNVAEIERRGPVAVSNLKIHVLTDGCVYDGRTRQAHLPHKTLLADEPGKNSKGEEA
ncbi:MAG: cyanophycinase [Anaerolineae bacterium]|nr:MAG: cyanophycinase [Anaerolineae bacterium]